MQVPNPAPSYANAQIPFRKRRLDESKCAKRSKAGLGALIIKVLRRVFFDLRFSL